MSESLISQAFPLSEGLLLAAQEPLAPSHTYERFYNWCSNNGYGGRIIYGSTAITSGGYSRLPETVDDAIEKNTSLAKTLMLQVVRDEGIDPVKILFAADLPKVAGWTQQDYLLFWFHCIQGLEPAEAYGVDKMLTNRNYPGFTDVTLPQEERWLSYRQFTLNYLYASMDSIRTASRQAVAVVQLVDTDASLGCRAEELFASGTGIETMRVDIRDSEISHQLRKEIGLLANSGIEAVVPAQPSRLIPNRVKAILQ